MPPQIVEPNTCFRGCCRSQTIPLRLPPSSYSLSFPVARGAESVVYEAILQGERVAVKKPALSTSEDLDKFHRQLQLLCKLDHPGIAKLVAAHALPPNYMFFYEFYERGSLAEILHVEEWNPSVDQVLQIMFQLAKALTYLQSLGIVHRDVKPANILLDRAFNPYLADFGLAEYKKDLKQMSAHNWKSSGKPTGGFHKKNMVGTLIYMAPEILRKDTHTEKSDVYSYGITFNELLTGVVPYTDLRAEAQAHTVLEMNYTEQKLTAAIVSERLRPALASPTCGSSSNMLSLIQRCWDADPLTRPSFDDIVVELDAILKYRDKEKKQEISPASVAVIPKDVDATSARITKESINWMTKGEDSSKDSCVHSDSDLSVWLDTSKDSIEYSPVVSCGSFGTCGRRENMEDRLFLTPNFSNDIHMFGIFDGHRGAAAAEFSVGALPLFLRNSDSTNRNPCDALVEAFMKTDDAFRKELNSHRNINKGIQKDWHPGCTAIAALVIKNRLFVANAGDCRTILCRGGHPYSLSKDHVASFPEERQRVINAGGDVKWIMDTWRVGQAGLQVTRSIGDDDLKPAVTVEPEITSTFLSMEDEYIVMANDGLWDVVSNTDVVSIIKDTVKEPGMCAKRLATEAVERGSKDNVTNEIQKCPPESQTTTTIDDDALSLVFGKEARGRVRGMCFGVTPSKVGAQIQNNVVVNQLQDEVRCLKEKFDELSSILLAQTPNQQPRQEQNASGGGGIVSGIRNGINGDGVNDATPQSNRAIRENMKCKLLHPSNGGVVAEGRIASTDPKAKVHHIAIGEYFWKVWVDKVIAEDVALIHPNDEMTHLEHARGSTVAWLSAFIILDD